MLWNGFKKIRVLGAAASVGQPKFGVSQTPAILKSIGIEKWFPSQQADWVGILDQERSAYENPRLSPIRNLPEVASYNKRLYEKIVSHASPNEFFLTIGGDHSIGSSTISAMLKVHNENIGVIWVDAHGDCNTPLTSTSGNYHGMPLSQVLGLFEEKEYLSWGQPLLKIDSLAIIGVRDLEKDEKALMDKSGVLYYSMDKVKQMGIKNVIDEAMGKIDPHNKKMIHLSMDVDGLDPTIIPGTGTLASNGLSMKEYEEIVKRIKMAGERFASMDLVEINFEIEKEVTLKTVQEIVSTTFK